MPLVSDWLRNQALRRSNKPQWLQAVGRTPNGKKIAAVKAGVKILGGGMVGTHAGDMIGEIALAIEMGADSVDIGKTIHPHPTLGESIGSSIQTLGHSQSQSHSQSLSRYRLLHLAPHPHAQPYGCHCQLQQFLRRATVGGVHGGDVEVPQDGRNRQLDLQQRQVAARADARASAERH